MDKVPAQSLKTLEKFPKSSLSSIKLCSDGGGFGKVITAHLQGKLVVVKLVHAPIAKKKVVVLQQIARLEHRNLIEFLGIVDLDPEECPQLIYKHVNKGSLLAWLREGKEPVEDKLLNKLTLDIINGMDYLHSNMNFIHGCLAARNVLLDEFSHPNGRTYINAKISDYGMTRVIEGMGPNYFVMAPGKSLSIRWMPKEAIATHENSGEVTTASDVWSFAVVLWEMWTKGDIPYGITASNTCVKQHILNGSSPLTFHRPVNCPNFVMDVMKNIFKVNQQERPTFLDLKDPFNPLPGAQQLGKAVKTDSSKQDLKSPSPDKNNQIEKSRSSNAGAPVELKSVKTTVIPKTQQFQQKFYPKNDINGPPRNIAQPLNNDRKLSPQRAPPKLDTPTSQNAKSKLHTEIKTSKQQFEVSKLICTDNIALEQTDLISQTFLDQAADRLEVKQIRNPIEKVNKILEYHKARNGGACHTLENVAELLKSLKLADIAEKISTMKLPAES